ncbi:MAG: Mur ligase domain-containing protein, partial [Clostridiales bacterium]|nr:Mur ligase domain-containing protein [Clostridiales bacterium]
MDSNSVDLKKAINIHFIGIGGSSMSGLAKIMKSRGCVVSGSDCARSKFIEMLESLGISLVIGHSPNNIPKNCDLVIYTLAIDSKNPELLEAQRRGIQVVERGTFLGLLTKEYPKTLAISGTHGKTTTSSMCAEIFLAADLDPSIHIGGELSSIGGNVRSGKGPFFLTEACEYHDNFLHLHPFAGIILNIEAEHLDYFK